MKGLSDHATIDPVLCIIAVTFVSPHSSLHAHRKSFKLTTTPIECTSMNVHSNRNFLSIGSWLLSEDVDRHAILTVRCTFAAKQLFAGASANSSITTPG